MSAVESIPLEILDTDRAFSLKKDPGRQRTQLDRELVGVAPLHLDEAPAGAVACMPIGRERGIAEPEGGRHDRPGAYRQPRSAQGMGHRPRPAGAPLHPLQQVPGVCAPLGCYELARYGGDYDRIIKEVYEVFNPPF
jgi:hypothetical protein